MFIFYCTVQCVLFWQRFWFCFQREEVCVFLAFPLWIEAVLKLFGDWATFVPSGLLSSLKVLGQIWVRTGLIAEGSTFFGKSNVEIIVKQPEWLWSLWVSLTAIRNVASKWLLSHCSQRQIFWDFPTFNFGVIKIESTPSVVCRDENIAFVLRLTTYLVPHGVFASLSKAFLERSWSSVGYEEL